MADEKIIQVVERDGVTIARVRLEAILNEAQVQAFGKALLALADVPGRRVILNFLGLQHLTSLALGELIRLHKRLAESGGELCLADIDPRIYELFSITRLDRLFRIFDREEEAVAALLAEGRAGA
ncbi:MAG TPA: STAS domain-containing protein [Phycisphaerae bacterium]|nr:STAS domain-containing protein [Phycisphaerae bacterium]